MAAKKKINRKLKIVNLSHPISTESPMYSGSNKPEIISIKSIKGGDSSNTFQIKILNHTGTHVDAPAHFIADGRPISDYEPEELIFKQVQILDIPKNNNEHIEMEDVISATNGIKKTNLDRGHVGKFIPDCMIFKTGFGSKHRSAGSEPEPYKAYQTQNPGISPEAIEYIRKNFKKVRCIAIDSISISSFGNRQRGREAHKRAFEKKAGLGEPILLIEDVNLGQMKAGMKIKKMTVVPWFILGIDSAPCSILAEVE